MASKNNIANFVKNTDFDNKLLNGAKYISSAIFQNYLVFIQAKKYIKYFSGTSKVDSWKSNGVSEESIENITKSAILHQSLLIIIYYKT